MILFIDNYDSFVHNIARYFLLEGRSTMVMRERDVSSSALDQLLPSAIVLSPGPGNPSTCSGSLTGIEWARARVPLLGICLGHQCLGHSYGMRVDRAIEPMHGRSSMIHHSGTGIFRGLSSPLQAGRYHSLIVKPDGCHSGLRVDAVSEGGEIMAVSDEAAMAFGIQFHPESVLTPQGREIIRNFLTVLGD